LFAPPQNNSNTTSTIITIVARKWCNSKATTKAWPRPFTKALADPNLATHHKHLHKIKEKNMPKQDDHKDPNPAFQRLKSSQPK